MPKSFKLSLALATSALIAWTAFTYPAVGQLTYEAVSGTEARLYGLHKRHIQVGGVPFVIYESDGMGEPILMLHGFTADKDVWARFARHFAQGHRVIVPDLPGHGETGRQPALNYGMTAQVERLVALLDALKVGKIHVIGNSMGGNLAAQFALDHPERTLSMALVDPAGLPQPHPSAMRRMLASGHNPFLIQSRSAFYSFYPMTMADPPFMPGFVLDAIADRYIAQRQAFAHIFADIEQPTRLQSQASDIQAPGLLLWGREDQLIDVSAVQSWRQVLPGLKVVVWDGVGHMPMVERPGETAELYQAFIDGLPR
jgi:abhydrolase domain-containing protein 6